jgi:hypothetical protein
MNGPNPLDALIHLAPAAAEAGKDWRALVRSQWVPDWIRKHSRASLVAALDEWGMAESSPGEDLAAALEDAVITALDEAGYR